jgi:hypothetical protein
LLPFNTIQFHGTSTFYVNKEQKVGSTGLFEHEHIIHFVREWGILGNEIVKMGGQTEAT